MPEFKEGDKIPPMPLKQFIELRKIQRKEGSK